MTSPTGPLAGSGPVESVLFDYGLTLVGFARPEAAIQRAQAHIAACITAHGHVAPSVSRLREAIHDRVEAEVTAHEESGALTEVDVVARERAAFSDLGLALEDAVLDECSRIIQEAWLEGVRVLPDVVPALTSLRAGGLRLGLCSNAPYRAASMHEQLSHVGLSPFLDAATFSSEVGWRKPSPRIFGAALAALQASAESTVFIGDRMREDVGGAAAAGMRTVLVDRSSSPRPSPDHPQDVIPDAVIADLRDLPRLLGVTAQNAC